MWTHNSPLFFFVNVRWGQRVAPVSLRLTLCEDVTSSQLKNQLNTTLLNSYTFELTHTQKRKHVDVNFFQEGSKITP